MTYKLELEVVLDSESESAMEEITGATNVFLSTLATVTKDESILVDFNLERI